MTGRVGVLWVSLAACGGGGSTGTEASSSGEPGGTSSASSGAPDPTTGGGSSSGSTGAGTGGSGASGSEGSSSSGAGSSGPPPGTSVPVFVAQGHLGRTTVSCDDGETWIHDVSQDDAGRCFEDGLDCDHHAFAGRGIAYGAETFVLTWGWGAPGTVVRSEDAATFETVLTETPTFADVAFGNGRFVANNGTTQISDDLGKTWGPGGSLGFAINTRSITFAPHDGGVFIVTGESGEERAIVRSSDGVVWTPASVRPPECGNYVIGAAYGAGTVILASGSGHVCRSTDGGDTWEHVPVGGGLSSPPVWTGAEFFVYEGSTLHRSADGASWQSGPISPQSAAIGPLARSPEGTFVAANAGWMVWYEEQRLYRSTDGVNWESLPPGAYAGSHPIYFIEHGYVPAGAGCPG